MRRLTSTVCVVSCTREGEWHGMTATAVTSVCDDPASILVCINGSASIYRPLLESSRFCVNMLHQDQHSVSSAFSGRLRGRDRFAADDWVAGVGDIPRLVRAQAAVFATVSKVILHGTHAIVIGDVEHVVVGEKVQPLLYQDGKYARAELMDMESRTT